MLFCHKRRKSYKFTEDVARDWDYYIPGVEWSPSHMCTVTKYKQKTKENENVKSTTTEINYKIDPDEYRFSLPSKDKYLINSESPSDEDLNSSINVSSYTLCVFVSVCIHICRHVCKCEYICVCVCLYVFVCLCI